MLLVAAPVAEYAKQLPKSFYVPKARTTKNRRSEYLDELFDALVIGMRDYFEKTGVFERFLVALSGGRDSALCLLIAVEAAKALKEATSFMAGSPSSRSSHNESRFRISNFESCVSGWIRFD